MRSTMFHLNNTHTQKTAVVDVQSEAHLRFPSDFYQWALFCNVTVLITLIFLFPNGAC